MGNSACLALAGHLSNDHVTIEMPYGLEHVLD